jgi:hypothetical protein
MSAPGRLLPSSVRQEATRSGPTAAFTRCNSVLIYLLLLYLITVIPLIVFVQKIHLQITL